MMLRPAADRDSLVDLRTATEIPNFGTLGVQIDDSVERQLKYRYLPMGSTSPKALTWGNKLKGTPYSVDRR